MGQPHKWEKEIKAWADGAEIESQCADDYEWQEDLMPDWDDDDFKFRIKPTPKEPQYLYAYKVNAKIVELYDELQMAWDGKMLLGKIKLETDNE